MKSQSSITEGVNKALLVADPNSSTIVGSDSRLKDVLASLHTSLNITYIVSALDKI